MFERVWSVGGFPYCELCKEKHGKPARFSKCGSCRGLGIVAGPFEYSTEPCGECGGKGSIENPDVALAEEAASVEKICSDIAALPLPDQGSVEKLGAVARGAATRLAFLEESRKTETRPHQAKTKRIQDRYRAPEKAYGALVDACRARLTRHAREVRERQAQAQAQAGQLFQAAQAAPAASAALVQAGHAALASAPASFAAEGISARGVWTYEIVNPGEIPRQFCEPSPKLLREAVAAGVREISGVRIFQDQSIRITKESQSGR